MTVFLTPSAETTEKAAALLASGHLVVLPTETVYGLGADASDSKAVQKIFETKNRPAINPLIIHVDGLDMAERFGDFDGRAKCLIQNYWPGPLTLVVPLKPDCGLAPAVTAGLNTVAIRCPAHDAMRDVITKLGRPIAAPSANTSGRLSPTTPEHVLQSFKQGIDHIVIGGKSVVGLESTIIDVSGADLKLLRAGYVTVEDLEMLMGGIQDMTGGHDDVAPSSPGQMLRHYAPQTPLRLNAVDVDKNEALLGFGSVKFMGIKQGGALKDLPDAQYMNLSETGDLAEAAGNLFSMLHHLDQIGAQSIAVMNIPNTGIGRALNDRLTRAAQGATTSS